MKKTHIRSVRATDIDFVHVLNDAAVPAVNRLDENALCTLLDMASYTRIVEHDGERAGCLIGFDAKVSYDSPNFQWFGARYDAFAYVDRVIIAEAHRGQGLGTVLYEDFERRARDRAVPYVTCEVNIRPRNDASLAFHYARGFEQVATQETERGKKTVSLMVKRID